MEQPKHRPAHWQLHGEGLGYLLILEEEHNNNQLLPPKARLALKTQTTTIGSSNKLTTICLQDQTNIQPIHLIITINTQTHRASLQVVGSSGITLNQEHLNPSPELIPLNDRDTFYINQFPFRWEQRWDDHLIDWSRFDQQPAISSTSNQTLLLDILPEPSSPPATPSSNSKNSPCKLLISPTKTNCKELLFQWEPNHSQESSLDSSHVSFRKRSHPRSIKAASQNRTQSTDDSSSEDEEHLINFKNHTSPPATTTQQHHQSPLPSESPLSPTSPSSSSPINLDLTSLEEPQPRRKSLLQKLLIKQAVQTHLAHQSDPIEPNSLAASGFSSSEDDEDDQEDDPDSPDDDLAQDTNKLDDISSDEDHPTRMDNCNLSPARDSPPQSNPTAPSDAIFSSKPRPLSPAKNGLQPVSLPSTITRPVLDRRSMSPNAKLLSAFQSHSPSSPPPPATLVFPLKSSFRRQSYSADELAAFSSASTSPNSNPSTPSPSTSSHSARQASVRLNTQINSRSPSFPVDPHPFTNPETLRNRLRSSVRTTGSAPLPPPPPPQAPQAQPTPPNKQPDNITRPNTIPHRIIRTPRSFLIKRRGSLTPLTAPTCGPDPLLLLQSETQEDYEYFNQGDEKRKVRFDRDVFCLEFDQLPEELPLSRQPKRAKVLVEEQPDPPSDNAKRNGQRRNTLPSTTTNRPRRQSPRLAIPATSISTQPLTTTTTMMMVQEEEELEDSQSEEAEEDVLKRLRAAEAQSSIASVDLSGLSINPPSASSSPSHSGYPHSPAAIGQSPSTSTSLSLEEQDQDQAPKKPEALNRRRGSIIEAFAARLFPSSYSTTTTTESTRRSSMPANFGRLDEVESRLKGLRLTPSSDADPALHSLDPHHVSATHILRTRSEPVPSSSSSFPSIPTFAPNLQNVKQLFLLNSSFNNNNGNGNPLASIGTGFASLVNGIKRIGSPRASAITTDDSSDSEEDSEDLESDSDGSEGPNSSAQNDLDNEVGDDQEEGKEENEEDRTEMGDQPDDEDDDETKKNLGDQDKIEADPLTPSSLTIQADPTSQSRVPDPPAVVRRRPGRPKKQPLVPASGAADSNTESGAVSHGRPRRTRDGGDAASVGGAATGRRGRGARGGPEAGRLSAQLRFPHPGLLLNGSSAPSVGGFPASSKTSQAPAVPAVVPAAGPTLRPRKGKTQS
ncbi:hypothetical protein PGT21_020500 [Puccinia graminis f. sp. tritici]|uniref:FHA domain-containing protein n=1 Tax=Puccinia graminis f. sp. tritici TaxID=56615 RepID=A0A5B0LK31_PUCGR|nr:hypothetical protein PGT21_020500 [Puccinia graminis f. sp. tritici]